MLSPDGSQLVTSVATPDADGTRYRTALWRVDPSGARPARPADPRRPGESSAVFTDVGDMLFTSARPDPEADEDEEGPAALWLLPAEGGEARLIGNRLGGSEKIDRDADVVADSAAAGADLADEDASGGRAGTSTSPRSCTGLAGPALGPRSRPGRPRFSRHRCRTRAASTAGLDLTDLTPDARPNQADFDLAPDGRRCSPRWRVDEPHGERHAAGRLDLADGSVRPRVDDPDDTVDAPDAVSPDGAVGRLPRSRSDLATEPPHVRCVARTSSTAASRASRAGLGPLDHRTRLASGLRGIA